MFSYSILLDLVTSFACLVFAGGLLRFWNRNRAHVLFSLVALCLAVGFLFRSAYLFQPESIFPKIAYMAFSFFPVLLTLFIEKSSGRIASSTFKLFQIFSIIFIIFPLLDRNIREHVPWWITYFMFYHLVCVFYLSYLLFVTVRTVKSIQEKNIFRTLLVGTFVSSVFIGMDWLSRLGYDFPRISALPMLIMIYMLATIFYGQARFSFYFELLKLSITVVFSFVVALVFTVYMGFDNWFYVWELTFVLSTFLICGQFMSRQYRFNYDRSLSELLREIHLLPKRSLQVYLQSLQDSRLLQDFTVLSAEELEQKQCRGYKEFFRRHPHPLSRQRIEKKLNHPSLSLDVKNQMQELKFIMEMTGTDYLSPIGETGMILASSSVKLMDPFSYEQILEIISNQIAGIASRPGVAR